MTLPTTYKAVLYDRLGPVNETLALRDIPMEPLPASYVRIQVHSAAINPVDWKTAEIFGAQFTTKPNPTPEQPYRIGWDAAGVVVEVESAVNGFKVGDQVNTTTGMRDFGSLAEYLAVDAEHSRASACCFSAASATGIYAIQHFKALGAYVIATTSSKNTALVKSLGADEVIDYRTKKWRDEGEAHSIDIVFDCGFEFSSWEDDAQAVLKKDAGRFVTLQPFVPHSDAEFGASYSEVVVHPSGKHLAEIGKLYDAGKAKLVVDSVFPLEQAKEAFAHLKTGHTAGKVIVKVL